VVNRIYIFNLPLGSIQNQVGSTDSRTLSVTVPYVPDNYAPGFDNTWVPSSLVRYTEPGEDEKSLNTIASNIAVAVDSNTRRATLTATLNDDVELAASTTFRGQVVPPMAFQLQQRNFDSSRFFPKTSENALDDLIVFLQYLNTRIGSVNVVEEDQNLAAGTGIQILNNIISILKDYKAGANITITRDNDDGKYLVQALTNDVAVLGPADSDRKELVFNSTEQTEAHRPRIIYDPISKLFLVNFGDNNRPTQRMDALPFRGDWVSRRLYSTGQVVSRQGLATLFMARTEHGASDTTPPEKSTTWIDLSRSSSNISIQKASTAEIKAGADDAKYVTPLGLRVNSSFRASPMQFFNANNGRQYMPDIFIDDIEFGCWQHLDTRNQTEYNALSAAQKRHYPEYPFNGIMRMAQQSTYAWQAFFSWTTGKLYFRFSTNVATHVTTVRINGRNYKAWADAAPAWAEDTSPSIGKRLTQPEPSMFQGDTEQSGKADRIIGDNESYTNTDNTAIDNTGAKNFFISTRDITTEQIKKAAYLNKTFLNFLPFPFARNLIVTVDGKQYQAYLQCFFSDRGTRDNNDYYQVELKIYGDDDNTLFFRSSGQDITSGNNTITINGIVIQFNSLFTIPADKAVVLSTWYATVANSGNSVRLRSKTLYDGLIAMGDNPKLVVSAYNLPIRISNSGSTGPVDKAITVIQNKAVVGRSVEKTVMTFERKNNPSVTLAASFDGLFKPTGIIVHGNSFLHDCGESFGNYKIFHSTRIRNNIVSGSQANKDDPYLNTSNLAVRLGKGSDNELFVAVLPQKTLLLEHKASFNIRKMN